MQYIFKYTKGEMRQKFDLEGNFIGQEFIAGDEVDFEDENGNHIPKSAFTDPLYHPFSEE